MLDILADKPIAQKDLIPVIIDCRIPILEKRGLTVEDHKFINGISTLLARFRLKMQQTKQSVELAVSRLPEPPTYGSLNQLVKKAHYLSFQKEHDKIQAISNAASNLIATGLKTAVSDLRRIRKSFELLVEGEPLNADQSLQQITVPGFKTFVVQTVNSILLARKNE